MSFKVMVLDLTKSMNMKGFGLWYQGQTLLLIQELVRNNGNIINNLADGSFFDLLRAVNYLDFERFFDAFMAQWVNSRPFPGVQGLDALAEKAITFYQGDARSAAFNGHLGVVKMFLRKNQFADVSELLSAATEGEQLAVVDLILQQANIRHVNPSFVVAISRGNLAIVNRFLEDIRTDPMYHEGSPIRSAIFNNRMAILERLIQDHRVDPEVLRPYLHKPEIEALYNQYRRDKRQRVQSQMF